jgi:MFS transporter, YNFM family, putative membrane transport protein
LNAAKRAEAAGRAPRAGKIEARGTFAVLTRTIVIGLVAFLTLVDLFATQAILPLLRQAYNVTPVAMGLAVNASTIGMAVASLVVAFFSQKIDRRRGIILSLALLAIPTVCLAFAPNLAVFTTLRIVQGLCMASAFTLTLADLGEHCSARDTAGAFAAYVTGNVGSNLFGRLMSAAVADHFGLASNFFVFAGLNIAGAILVYMTIDRAPPIAAVGVQKRSASPELARHLGNSRLRAAFAIGFCILYRDFHLRQFRARPATDRDRHDDGGFRLFCLRPIIFHDSSCGQGRGPMGDEVRNVERSGSRWLWPHAHAGAEA